jgi:hypothetical protein
MRRRVRLALEALLIAAMVLALACGVGDPCASPAPPSKLILRGVGGIPNQYIVVLDRRVPDPDRLGDYLAAKHGGTIFDRWHSALLGFAISMPDAEALPMSLEPGVCYVEQNGNVFFTD